MIKNVHFNVDIYTDANELLGKNPEGDRNPAHKMVSRVLNLQPKEQKIVIQTISALMDGIEGIR